MKAHDNGSLFSVSISVQDVRNFKETWPCSELRDCSIWAQFQKSNGDLVDLEPRNIDGEALVALLQDAQNYAAKKLKLSAEAYRK